MHITLVDHARTPADDQEVAELLLLTFVEAGYTSRERTGQLTAPDELARRGRIILARASASPRLAGMVILAAPDSPYRQIAQPGEGEVQLLAVHPAARGQGLGGRLLAACEDGARERDCARMVLSTQPTMTAAHRLSARTGYQRVPARDWRRSDAVTFLAYGKELAAPPPG